MKNSILTFVIILCATITVNAQNTQYANLQSGYNFANNTIAADYAKTGVLPAGYTTKTTQQICQQYGKEKMWVKYDQAAPANTVINGGHYANPAEVFIFTPEGNLLCAAKCGNYVNDVKFEGTIQVNVTVETQVVDLTEVNQKLDGISNGVNQLGQNQVVILEAVKQNQALIQQNGNALAVVLTNQEAQTAHLEAIHANTKFSAYADGANVLLNLANLGFNSGLIKTRTNSATVQYVTNTIDSFNTTTNTTTTNGTTTPSTGGPDLNGSN